MADIDPFRGWRYDLSQVGALSDVTAPPYDVISPDEQSEFYQRHPCNVIRLILNRTEPGDQDDQVRYRRASQFFEQWKRDAVLVREREDAIYVYHQQFEWEGRTYDRHGFLARLKLENLGEGTVFPHEQTMSGPKVDRLLLTRACRANLSPIFGLYDDEENVAQRLLDEAVSSSTAFETEDSLGVRNRLWAVTDHNVINQVRERLRSRAIFIADGHHRYETALNYRNELRDAGKLKPDDPAEFVMMMFVSMSDPGLAILPTHRIVSGWGQIPMTDVVDTLAPHFDMRVVDGGEQPANQAWEDVQLADEKATLAFGTPADGKWVVASLRDPDIMATLADTQSEEWRGLVVSVLHRLVLDHLLSKRFGSEPTWKYVHKMEEVTDAMRDDTASLVSLVPPASLEDVRAIAGQLEKMPPKSTFFYPKLLSGLVIHDLQD